MIHITDKDHFFRDTMKYTNLLAVLMLFFSSTPVVYSMQGVQTQQQLVSSEIQRIINSCKAPGANPTADARGSSSTFHRRSR